MKLVSAGIQVVISEMGTYRVSLIAENSGLQGGGAKVRHMSFELPVGNRPILEDLSTILRMVAEELSR